jgi:hypothetical protein
MMELKHVRAFGTTPHPPQPHHPVRLEISVKIYALIGKFRKYLFT